MVFFDHSIITLSCYFRCHRAGSQLKNTCIANFGYKQRLLSIEMKTKLVQHVESDWMREWESVRVWECESVRVWECESERVIFEHRHENKSCSACWEWVNERVKEWESERMRECERVIWFPAFVWGSDIFLLHFLLRPFPELIFEFSAAH